MDKKKTYEILDSVNNPADLKKLSPQQLPQLASELRDLMVNAVAQTGGHLGAGLGVVELTIALHYIFDTPNDKLIWDVGHQAYPHKILTGRKDKIFTLRQFGGLSGFTTRTESEYDPFGAAHSSTSISAGLGMAVARDLAGDDYNVIAVIGDGALSAGMAFEALNNAGALKTPMIVIINDNDMSIARPVGALSAYLSRLLSSRTYLKLRKLSIDIIKKLPDSLEKTAKRADEFMRGFVQGGTLFEELGFFYVGLIDGHNFDQLLPVLNNLKNAHLTGPVIVHVKTEKGKGYKPAESAPDRYHGVNKFDPESGEMIRPSSNIPQWTKIFGETLANLANNDEKIVGITAAMPSGTGLDIMQKIAPKQVFDVGIAEQHAVTFAGGLAVAGFKPFVAIYSTFMQRAFDQVVHDIALQNLPVRLCLDRAGYVGNDGATHAGNYDLAYLGCIPNLAIMSPADSADLRAMIEFMAQYDQSPIAIRYPRGGAVIIETTPEPIILGRGRVLARGERTAVLCLGPVAYKIMEILPECPIKPTLVDMRFAKPVDSALILQLCQTHQRIISVEEGSIGGMSAQIWQVIQDNNLQGRVHFHAIYYPDENIDHATPEKQNEMAGFTPQKFLQLINGFVHK